MKYKAFTISLHAALTGEHADPPPYSLYVVRDGETVFYVGKTRQIEARLALHLEHRSLIGTLITRNKPQSDAWQVDLIAAEDCQDIVRAIFPPVKDISADEVAAFFGHPPPDSPRAVSVEKAERALIRFLHPCLNAIHNIEPGRLPERYREHDAT